MRQLLKSVIIDRKATWLICFSILFMVLLTLASQLEVLALGIVTKKGPDFFELFAPIQGDKLEKKEVVHWSEVKKRWKVLSAAPHQEITREEVAQFTARYKGNDLISQATALVNHFLPISTSMAALAFFLVTVAIFKAITLFGHRFLAKVVSISISKDLRQAYFEHLQKLPIEFYQKYHIGHLSSRVVGDATLIAEAVNASLVNYLQTPFTVFSTLVLCFITSWQLSLIIFFGFPLIVFPILFLAKRVRRIARQLQKSQEIFASVLIDFLSGIQTVKVFAMEEFSLKKYREQNAKMAALETKGARYDLSSRPIIHTIGMFFLATALLYGLYVQQMSVSEVLIYCGFLYIFYEPIKKFAEENSHIQRGIAAAERMQEVTSISPTIQDRDGAIVLEKAEGRIEFDQVWFRYQSDWILKGVSFTVYPGETVAIVGPTGAGKSTIVQLLPRLYEIERGEIRIDGKEITSYTQRSLRENIAFVPQKPFLFLDTVNENIAFGRSFSQEEICQAAILAHADEFITQLPHGYHSELSEAGKNLSGGQQQRLAIARALVKKAPILIMDEATSALDVVSESFIKETLNQLGNHVTKILIAHRLSTIEHADRIIYLEKGEKIAEGNKETLLANCPGFKNMWQVMHHQKA